MARSRVVVICLPLVNILLLCSVVVWGGDTPAQALRLKTTVAPTPYHTQIGQTQTGTHRRRHPNHRRHRYRSKARGKYGPGNISQTSPKDRLDSEHFPSLNGYVPKVDLGPDERDRWGDGPGEEIGSAMPPPQVNTQDMVLTGRTSFLQPIQGSHKKEGMLYRDQGHWPRTHHSKQAKPTGKPAEKHSNNTGIPLYGHPLYDLLHNKEFVTNASESLADLKELQKDRLNKIYDVYMNNSMELLVLESKLHHIGAEMMLNKDTHEELEKTLERYRSLVNSMRIDASKEIQSCLKDIHFQSDQVMDDIEKDVNKTSEFKHFVADQLEEVCEYLKTDEKMTIHDLQEGLIQRDEENAMLRQQIYDLKKENNHLRVESEGFQTLTKTLATLLQDSERTQETLHMMEKQLGSMKKVVTTIGYPYQQVTYEWKLYPFEYDTSWSGCEGPQYVQLSGYNQVGQGKYVGVVLCSPAKYKIFLSDDLNKKFLNIGDRTGNGEDHCEFVRSYRKARFVSNDVGPPTEIDGFGRAHWGQRPYRRKIGLHHGYRSPKWYDCGIAIP